MDQNSTYTLANGVKVPVLGFGTWQSPNGEIATNAVKTAFEVGYRHIDTASAYGNEESVGAGLRASGLPREEVFLTSKLWNKDHGYDETLAAFDMTLAQMKAKYLDLYLIHWPIPMERRTDWKDSLLGTWNAMIKLYKDGRIRAIGVSNFRPHHIEHLVRNTSVVPMVNQIEYHPGFWQKYVADFCKDLGILIQAWSPMAQGRVFGLPLLKELSTKYSKSVAQICIRWALQKGVNPLPKSVTAARIKENFDVFDFNISDEDIAKIDSLPESGATGYDPDHFIYPS
ncbi:MAG: aldo/keto reductase [Thermoguttaceae bacterium]|jgi:diketogulonate reductase-like aldo/keto reductase